MIQDSNVKGDICQRNMGRSMLWIQILYVFFMPDSSSGLRCLSCKSVEYIDECYNSVTTCAEGNICYILETRSFGHQSNELGCKPKSQCPYQPTYSGGTWVSYELTCCDNGDLCVLNLPEVIAATFPPKVTHLDPPFITGSTSLQFQSRQTLFCKSNATRSVSSTTWLFNGGSKFPPHASYSSGSSILYITGMTMSEVGNYTCIISKDEFTAETSVWISLIEVPRDISQGDMLVQQSDLFFSKQALRLQKAHVSSVKTSPAHRPQTNDYVKIICTVTGYPVPIILWSFKDPMGLYYVPQDVSYPTSNTVLIPQFQPSLHSGTWTCMARNSLGADQMSIEI